MAGGFPLRVDGIRILTSEALYQACRFPHLADVQRLIIGQKSPMAAKMKSKLYRHQSRPDWNRVRVSIMRWCLRVKLAQNWDSFSKLLLQTGDSPIVEQSRRDDFWGALPVGEQTLVGMNVLGRLLMELRESIQTEVRSKLLRVEPLPIRYFLLGGRPIESVAARELGRRESVAEPDVHSRQPHTTKTIAEQLPLLGTLKADVPPRHEDTPTYAAAERYEHLTPYPAYKDSGAPWLGEVPVHWEVLPNRTLFTEVKERDHPEEQMLSVTITKGVIRQQALLTDSSKKDSSNQDKSAYKLVRPRDIAYNKMRAWQGAVGVSDYQGIVSPAYVVQRPREGADSRYLHYLLRTPAFAKEAERWSYGITSDMWSLRPEHFKMIRGCLPPLPEQTAIVRFLDHTDRRIRRYSRAKQKLIALLEEQKQAIIHQTVTGQIDVRTGQPYPAYKPSGVEWLGEMPAHWDEISLGRCLRRIAQGWSPTAAEGEIEPNQWSVLTLSSVKRGMFDATAIKPIPISAKIPEGIEIEDGDLLLTRSNTRELVGDVCIVEGARPKTVISDLIYRLTPEPAILERRFLMFQLLSTLGRRQIERDARGSSGTMPKITQRHIRSWRVLIPPLEEQHCIVKIIKDTEKTINNAVKGVRAELSLLREYRTRLIADVVTGKLDVREAVAALPEVDPLVADDTLGDALNPDVESALNELAAVPEEAEA